MRIAVASCWVYRDAWPPFFALFRKFWPDCPYPITLLTDELNVNTMMPPGVDVFVHVSTWCGILSKFAESIKGEHVLLLQEDFFLTHLVELPLIHEALQLFRENANLGAVRLFPCPGAIGPGDSFFGPVERNEKYRNSIQATIWDAGYLAKIADNSIGGAARNFEIEGTEYAAKTLTEDVMAFRRDLYPFPVQYMCSAISRGLWEPKAKELCDAHHISADWTRRGFVTA